jgi:N-formylglutamate deformylase
MDAPTFTLACGSAPLLVSFPHAGTELAPGLAQRLTPEALLLPDTDWHLPRLYAFARQLGATTLVARYSRYVIDLNRPPDDVNLYPGLDSTGLVPLDTFAKAPLYRAGQAPSADEVAARRARYWEPYHAALAQELARLQGAHGAALLWDAHSIVSQVPRFFAGKLPDLNLGSAAGTSCGAALQQAVTAVLAAQNDFTWVVDGRFKGGYITRRYGRPADGVQALQLEMCCSTYMDETPPFIYRELLAARVQPVLRTLLLTFLAGVLKA